MQISESEEGPGAHKSLIHLGKLIQVWVYIGKNQKQKKNEILLWNILMRKTNYLTKKKVLSVNLFYRLKHQNMIIKFS